MIELMVGLAILGISGAISLNHFSTYQAATKRTFEVEALTRILDIEMEKLRGCKTSTCLRAEINPSAESESWARAKLEKQVTRDRDGTYRVSLKAFAPDHRQPQQLEALFWVTQ